MKYSNLFTRTRKEDPKDETSNNAKLLLRAGFINKEMAGVYSFLPLGLKVFNNIQNIIREEMNAIGGQEIMMTALQDSDVWEKTGRWDDSVMDIWFKTKMNNGQIVGLANTHEEPITNLMKNFISSYKDLPVYAYQLQTKFRNEVRAKSGIMRVREFIMKDLYSFNKSTDDLDIFYEKAKQAYINIFDRVGIGSQTYITFASGGAFSKYSHEFQALCDAGEDIIYVNKERRLAVNKEVYTDEVLADLDLSKDSLEECKAIEVGNIFKLGTRFSAALGLNYTDQDGSEKPVVMGSYGIGPGRLMGTIVELNFDEKGMCWPDDNIFDPIGLLAFKEVVKIEKQAHYIIMAPAQAAVDMVKKYSIPNVHFLPPNGNEASVWAFHNAIDVLAHFRCDGETMGLNIAESMICGKPVITHVSKFWNAHLEYLDDSFSRIASVDDDKMYAKHMLEFLRMNKIELENMGMQAKQKAQSLFSIKSNIQKFEKIIFETLK
jgi:prolyl-tRNA synthetase